MAVRVRSLAVLVLSLGVLLTGPSSSYARDEEPEPPTVWAVGDSITAGLRLDHPKVESYPAQLRALGYHVETVGNSGQCLVVVGCLDWVAMTETVTMVLARAQPEDVLVLEAGANDLGRATDPQLKRGYRAVVRAGEALGVHVIVATIPPRGAARVFLRETTEPQRIVINDWLRTRRWPLADFDARLERRTDRTLAPRFDSGDGIHPNAAGALAMARLVAKLLDPS